MIDAPEILETSEQLMAYIPLRVPRSEIKNVMGPGIKEVFAALATQGIPPTGAWFTYHLKIEPEVFDFQICVPVKTPVVALGRVKPGKISARKVARTIYTGPYEGLGDAWGEFVDLIKAAGHIPAPDLWECYLLGPEFNPDPKSWRTELNRPLVEKE